MRSARPRRPFGGFTLLELLVVLAIVALASSVALPRAVAWLESAERRAWRVDLRAQLERYPVQAFLTGTPQQVDAERLRRDGATPWPADAEVALTQPLRYAASGAASGGELRLRLGAWEARWRVAPVTGDVEELTP